MTATNHVLTGAVFAAASVTILPGWAILLIAFLLHFVLDALPHFGQPGQPAAALNRLKWFLPIDMAVAAGVLLAVFIARPEHWLLIIAGGALCASPDLWSIGRFVRFLRHGDAQRNKGWFSQFHSRIQWGERLWGAWVELAWCLGFGYILLSFL